MLKSIRNRNILKDILVLIVSFQSNNHNQIVFFPTILRFFIQQNFLFWVILNSILIFFTKPQIKLLEESNINILF
jgi:hypothetical protein